jgi:hypothetical protein
MPFAIVQINMGSFGEEVAREPLKTNLQTKAEAESQAKLIVGAFEHHGFNEEHGYWWYRDGEKVFRVIIES